MTEFGTSGLLYRSTKLMYDRETQTQWVQFFGEPVVGQLADTGIKLEVLPVSVTTWGEWHAAHPDTTVLDIVTGVYTPQLYSPEDDPRSVYADYREDAGTMFPVWHQSDRLPTKAEVLGLKVNGRTKAYPLEVLRTDQVINDTLGGENLVVVTKKDAGAARAYQRGSHSFSLAEAMEGVEVILVDDQGGRWRMEEGALVRIGGSDERLKRLPSHMAYWFGWYSFYPDTYVYEGTQSTP